MNNYAKLIDGRLKYAPTTIRTADGLVCNPRPDKLIPLGYKEVIFDEQPEPSDPPKHYREVYTEEDDRHPGRLGGTHARSGAAARSRTVAGDGLSCRGGPIPDGLRGLSGRGQDTRSRRAEGTLSCQEGRDQGAVPG